VDDGFLSSLTEAVALAELFSASFTLTVVIPICFCFLDDLPAEFGALFVGAATLLAFFWTDDEAGLAKEGSSLSDSWS